MPAVIGKALAAVGRRGRQEGSGLYLKSRNGVVVVCRASSTATKADHLSNKTCAVSVCETRQSEAGMTAFRRANWGRGDLGRSRRLILGIGDVSTRRVYLELHHRWEREDLGRLQK